MASRLQLNLEFNRTEDRLMLRISERGAEKCVEYRLLLTRRFVKIFLKAIDRLLEDDMSSDMQISPEAMEAMKKFKQEAALAKTDFSTTYDSDTADCVLFDGGPILVSKLQITKKSKSKYRVSLLSEKNVGLNLNTHTDLLHSLRKMLVDAAGRADWRLSLKIENSADNMVSGHSKLVS
jgi:hypothetical protein